jgi:signal transduction histidine kinase
VEMQIDLPSRASGELPAEVEDTLYRLVQEALTNVVKHSGATHVSVSVGRDDGVLDVVVEDDGTGIDPQISGSGYGLVGMRERVDLVGGRIEIDSAPQTGTRVHATIPLARSADRQP